MCGIVAYIGQKEACPILLKGLRRLEYRGYDSAGIALLNGDLRVFKKKGKVQELVNYLEGQNVKGNIGIGHTRWATHGAPNDVNAHPHLSQSGRLCIIHNGIIENYSSLKKELERQGHTFKSDTDTEVLVHFIEEIQDREQVSLEEAVRLALNKVVGAYAIVVLERDAPKKLVAARMSSPLVIGVGKDNEEFYIASDATPIVEHTKNVVYLKDEEIAVVDLDNGLTIRTIQNEAKTPYLQELEMELDRLEKGGYDHFMLKEIYEQPRSLRDSMRGRVFPDKLIARLGGFRDHITQLVNAKRLIIVACGTSWHAGLVGEYLLEDLARINVEVEYASEFRYRNPVIGEGDVVLAISQSGETADTLAALKLAQSKGATILGIVNNVGSSIARLTEAGVYTHAGPEIGVASTKAFSTQLTVLSTLALQLADASGTITKSRLQQLLQELILIPGKIDQVLKADSIIKEIAETFKNVHHFLYLGRGYNFPVALEGALKLKEISYIHAEGYPAAEMKHGPIALIDENMPVIVIATNQSAYEKIVSNVQEVKARSGKVIAIVPENDVEIKAIADYTIEIPNTEEPLSPLLSVVPLQLLAYHIAVLRGCNVDQPRNLAKSVTVE